MATRSTVCSSKESQHVVEDGFSNACTSIVILQGLATVLQLSVFMGGYATIPQSGRVPDLRSEDLDCILLEAGRPTIHGEEVLSE
jgi:hypothetical protein